MHSTSEQWQSKMHNNNIDVYAVACAGIGSTWNSERKFLWLLAAPCSWGLSRAIGTRGRATLTPRSPGERGFSSITQLRVGGTRVGKADATLWIYSRIILMIITRPSPWLSPRQHANLRLCIQYRELVRVDICYALHATRTWGHLLRERCW